MDTRYEEDMYRGNFAILTFHSYHWTEGSPLWTKLADRRLAKRTEHAVSTFNFSLDDVESLCALVVRPTTISTETTPRTTTKITTSSSGGNQTMKVGNPIVTVLLVLVAHCRGCLYQWR